MKKLLILSLCILVLGCNQKPNKTQEREKEQSQKMINWINEDIELLATKHGIDRKMLLNVISDYEELTQGYSIITMFQEDETLRKNANKAEPKIISVQAAIEKVSNKYQLSKEKVASILIEHKLLEDIGGIAGKLGEDDAMPSDE